MKILKKVFLYLIYIAIVASFFAYYLFPSEDVKEYIAFKVNDANPNIHLKMNRIKPAFPPGLKFYDLILLHHENSVFEAEWLKVMPQVTTLFKPARVFQFKGRSYEGFIKGNAVISASEKTPDSHISVNTDLSGIQVKHINGLKNLYKHQIKGLLGGNIVFKQTSEDKITHAKLSVSNFTIEPDSPFFKIEIITFKSIDADFEIKNEGIQIKECVLQGDQVSGNISGSIILREPFDKSRLNLTGEMKLYPSLIEKLGSFASLLLRRGSEGKGIPFKIRGTVGIPKFSLK